MKTQLLKRELFKSSWKLIKPMQCNTAMAPVKRSKTRIWVEFELDLNARLEFQAAVEESKMLADCRLAKRRRLMQERTCSPSCSPFFFILVNFCEIIITIPLKFVKSASKSNLSDFSVISEAENSIKTYSLKLFLVKPPSRTRSSEDLQLSRAVSSSILVAARV